MVAIPDVHCHLASLADPEREIERALQSGVHPIVAVGMDRTSSLQGLELRRRFPAQILAGVGLHPSEIPRLDAERLQSELDFVHRTLPDADVLGEVGLDYKDAADEEQRLRQRGALETQLEWAAAFRKPVNLHCRRADRDVVNLATAFAARTGLGVDLHWFTHSEKLARECSAAGLFISVGPSILFDKAQAQVAAAIHPDLLLIETDTPVEFAGLPARPLWAMHVALQLAMLRGESFFALAARVEANLARYLHGKPTT